MPARQYAVVTVFMDDLSTLATEPFCYLTTTGRGSRASAHDRDLVRAPRRDRVSAVGRRGTVRLGQEPPAGAGRPTPHRWPPVRGPGARGRRRRGGGRVGAPRGDQQVPARLRRRPAWLARGLPAGGHRPGASRNRLISNPSDRVAIRVAVLACRDTAARALVAGRRETNRCAFQLPSHLAGN